MATFYAIGQILIVVNGQTLKQLPIWPSGHTDRQVGVAAKNIN